VLLQQIFRYGDESNYAATMAELGPLLKALLAKAKGVKVLDKVAVKVGSTPLLMASAMLTIG
jgi:hypothetical protein